jgi:hypothetical protein
MKINRNDIVELVLEHAINQGCYSQIYMDRLASMNLDELIAELRRLEDIAAYGSSFPQM